MSLLSMPVSQRLECLQELLSCRGSMYVWTYDSGGTVLETNCPDRVLDKVFAAAGCKDLMLAHTSEHPEPTILSGQFGLLWSAASEFEGQTLQRIHVFGPVITSEWSHGDSYRAIESSKIPPRWRPKLQQVLQRIPVTTTVDFLQHTLMLHYCVTGQRLTTADIVFQSSDLAEGKKEQGNPKRDRMRTWMAEQALIRMVREGDPDYKSVLQNASVVSRGVKISTKNLDQVRVSQIVFISLCTRAAIEGGLSPEVAYSRGDAYIQDIMDCKTVSDAAQIGHAMYDDFIQMVHKHRTNPNYSKPIQSCCDYIELHVEEKLSLERLAKHIGYVEYYLSRKFKEETGVSVNDYIKFAKIERAKTLLLSTELSIQEICDRLCFGSRSFFAETFKQIVGVPPAAYRQQNRHL